MQYSFYNVEKKLERIGEQKCFIVNVLLRIIYRT